MERKKIYYDFHIHTALSPCGDDESTPNNVVNMAKLKGLDIIAIADHNSVGNLLPCMKIAQEIGLPIIPGMELTTAEDIHILCLFESIEGAVEFEKVVRKKRMRIQNDIEAFGHQYFMNDEDEILGEEGDLLIMGTEIGVYDVVSEVDPFGGVAIPAHIDREGSGLVPMLGGIDDLMGFEFFELSKRADADFLSKIYLPKNSKILYNSDAHRFVDIFEGEENGGRNFLFSDELNKYPFIDKILSKI